MVEKLDRYMSCQDVEWMILAVERYERCVAEVKSRHMCS